MESGGPRIERLTRQADFYDKLVYSPDGKTLTFLRAPWQAVLRRRHDPSDDAVNMDLVAMTAGGGELVRLLEMNLSVGGYGWNGYGWPHFSQRDPKCVYLFVLDALSH